MWEHLREVFRNWQRKPFQSSLAIIGILFGMAGVLILSSMGAGVHQSIDKQVQAIGPGLMNIQSVPPLQGAPVPLTLSDAKAVTLALKGKAILSPITQMIATINGQKGSATGNVLGVNAEFPMIESISLSSGRFLTPLDDERMNQVAVIGNTLAGELFAHGHAVGKIVEFNQSVYNVIGVFSLSNGVAVSGSNNLVLIPDQTFAAQLSINNQISELLIKASNPSRVPRLKDTILTALVRDHGWHIPLSSFLVGTQNGILSASASLNNLFSMFVQGAVWISFIVGGIGIMNVMLMAITDRRREIGIFLAFGARPRFIIVQFLLESTLISLVGTLGGMVTGTLIGLVLMTHGVPFTLKVETFAQDIGIGILLGIIFGLYPSVRASLMTPSSAIRE